MEFMNKQPVMQSAYLGTNTSVQISHLQRHLASIGTV